MATLLPLMPSPPALLAIKAPSRVRPTLPESLMMTLPVSRLVMTC
jgi:hypothetical protein